LQYYVSTDIYHSWPYLFDSLPIIATHFLLPTRGEKQINITSSHHFPTIHQLQYEIDDIFDINKTATTTSITTTRSIEAAAAHQLQVGTINDDRSEAKRSIEAAAAHQ
jgi:hypothetical protein